MATSAPRSVAFMRGIKNCVERTWKETDTYYYIPKSRFKGGWSTGHASSVLDQVPRERRHLFRRFRDCVSYAWGASDRNYHIPKSRHEKAFGKHA